MTTEKLCEAIREWYGENEGRSILAIVSERTTENKVASHSFLLGAKEDVCGSICNHLKEEDEIADVLYESDCLYGLTEMNKNIEDTPLNVKTI